MTNKKQFIQFGGFIVDKNEINYCRLDYSNHEVKVFLKDYENKGIANTCLTQQHENHYEAQSTFDFLSMDLEPHIHNHTRNNALFRKMNNFENQISHLNIQLNKTLNKFKKELKK